MRHPRFAPSDGPSRRDDRANARIACWFAPSHVTFEPAVFGSTGHGPQSGRSSVTGSQRNRPHIAFASSTCS